MNAVDGRLLSFLSTTNKAAPKSTSFSAEVHNSLESKIPNLGTSWRDLHLGMAVAFGYDWDNRSPAEMKNETECGSVAEVRRCRPEGTLRHHLWDRRE
jgi:hypothetical protein